MKIRYFVNKDKRCQEFNTLIERKFPQLLIEEEPEIILACGGDGAMLHTIRNSAKFPDAIFFGKATGTFNFLMNHFDNDEKFINDLVQGKIQLDKQETNTIKVTIVDAAKKIIDLGEAVNEVVIGYDLMGFHNFELNSSDQSFENFQIKGTGLCLSTPLGSTAYNFNNGGVIIPLEADLLSLSGIVCNRYLNDLVSTQKLLVKILDKKGRLTVLIDGIDTEIELEPGSIINLEKGRKITLGYTDYEQFCQKRVNLSHRFRHENKQ